MITADALICQELVELATDYLEGTLDDRDLQLLEQHLGDCAGCSEYLEQLRATILISGTLQAATIAPEAESALLSAFRAWKNAS
jgi:hypothetical protein